VIHAKGILGEDLKGRITGMKLTFFTMIGLVALNLIYLPYGSLW
jgi:uncharacterized membrane protein YecN with MAPEG domain